jgi:hypothetical protein
VEQLWILTPWVLYEPGSSGKIRASGALLRSGLCRSVDCLLSQITQRGELLPNLDKIELRLTQPLRVERIPIEKATLLFVIPNEAEGPAVSLHPQQMHPCSI